MMTTEPYEDWRGVEHAIGQAVRQHYRNEPSISVSDLLLSVHRDRLLCRIFATDLGDSWVLKGGTGMLARVPNARTTMDIDLYLNGFDLHRSLSALIEAAQVDLGDYFRFTYIDHKPILLGTGQSGIQGCTVRFRVELGPKRYSPISVDLVAYDEMTSPPQQLSPLNRMALPRLWSSDYWVYPVENQLADKVQATVVGFGERLSTRYRDLVDMTIIGRDLSFNSDEVSQLLVVALERLKVEVPSELAIPSHWRQEYEALAAGTPAQAYGFDEAVNFVKSFVDPILIKAVGTSQVLSPPNLGFPGHTQGPFLGM